MTRTCHIPLLEHGIEHLPHLNLFVNADTHEDSEWSVRHSVKESAPKLEFVDLGDGHVAVIETGCSVPYEPPERKPARVRRQIRRLQDRMKSLEEFLGVRWDGHV